MSIAVIIPTLNEDQVIAQTLAHTARLGFDELVIVDGGSRDRTVELIAKAQTNLSTFDPSLDRPLRTSQPELGTFRLSAPPAFMAVPPGRARQMNAGAFLGRSDILLFLHADTRLPDDARRIIEGVMSDPQCPGGRFDVRFDLDIWPARVISRLMNLRSRLTGIATGDQAIFVRRAAFEAVGGFPDIPLMEDVAFSKRLKRLGGLAPLRSQVITSFRRWRARGPVRTVILMWTLRFLYWLRVDPRILSRFYAHVR
jgi:rSAM/selenodomain-associated transferase 2